MTKSEFNSLKVGSLVEHNTGGKYLILFVNSYKIVDMNLGLDHRDDVTCTWKMFEFEDYMINHEIIIL